MGFEAQFFKVPATIFERGFGPFFFHLGLLKSLKVLGPFHSHLPWYILSVYLMYTANSRIPEPVILFELCISALSTCISALRTCILYFFLTVYRCIQHVYQPVFDLFQSLKVQIPALYGSPDTRSSVSFARKWGRLDKDGVRPPWHD